MSLTNSTNAVEEAKKIIDFTNLKVGGYVDKQHLEEVTEKYRRTTWVDNSRRIGKPDSLTAYWTLAELESFFYTAKCNGADGIKVHFGTYSEHNAPDPAYVDRQTITLVAMKSDDSEEECGADHKEVYMTGKDNEDVLVAYNAANICPPFCNGLCKPDFIEWLDVKIPAAEEDYECRPGEELNPKM